MKLLCEKILSENKKLKFLDFDEMITSISGFLQENHQINNFKITLNRKNNSEVLYENVLKDSTLVDEIITKQDEKTNLIFSFYTSTKKGFEEQKATITQIKDLIEIFAQTIFNKYLSNSMKKLALIDQLTGSYTREYLNNYAKNILSISNRENKKIAFLKIAIDQFKAVIDEFDYKIGDEVLKALAKTLKDSVRDSDIVVKISDDEFLVILQNIGDENNATMISNKIINNFSKQKVIVDYDTKQTLMKTISSGISIYPDDATDINDILKKSDIALYEAKNRGRGQTFVFSKDDTRTIELF